MNRTLLLILLGSILFGTLYYFVLRKADTRSGTPSLSTKKPDKKRESHAYMAKLEVRAREIKSYAARRYMHGYKL